MFQIRQLKAKKNAFEVCETIGENIKKNCTLFNLNRTYLMSIKHGKDINSQ